MTYSESAQFGHTTKFTHAVQFFTLAEIQDPRNEARKWAIPFGIELASSRLVMFLHSSIVAWSNDRRGCVVYETEGGWIVQMTLGGFSTIEQPCASAREGLTVARGWRATCDESFAIGPKAA